MPTPSERTEKLLLRLAPQERAMGEEAAAQMGTSMNSALAALIRDGHAARYGTPGSSVVLVIDGIAVRLSEEAVAAVRQCAFETGATLAAAADLLVRRGWVHLPGPSCTSWSVPGSPVPPATFSDTTQKAHKTVPKIPKTDVPHIEGQTEIPLPNERTHP